MRLWWLPTLVLFILAFGFGGQYGVSIAQYIGVMIIACIVGIFSVALIGSIWKSWELRMKRLSSEHRFLCPGCLNFGLFEYACSRCGGRVDSLLVDSGGAFVKKCAHCHLALFADEDPEGRLIKTYCNVCDVRSDRRIYHNKSVRIFATLTSKDFDTLVEKSGATVKKSQDGLRYVARDHRTMLTFILNLGDLNNMVMPDIATHALKSLSVIWTDCSDVDPLEIGQTVDAMMMRTRLPEDLCRSITVFVNTSQIDPASRHVLETRFGHIGCGVSPADLVQGHQLNLDTTNRKSMTAARF
jgi:hypothetical protein